MQMEGHSLNHLFMQAPVAICIVSGPQYRIELVNESMLAFLGRTPEVIGRPLEETLTEAKKQGLLSILDRVRQTGEPFYASGFPAEILINGMREQRYFNLVFKPYAVSEEDQGAERIFCVAHNITEQVLITQKLEEEKRRTQLALETGELGILATDWVNNKVTADKRTREIFEFTGEPTVADFIERIHPDDRPKREKAIQQGIEKGSFDFELRILLRDGSIRWIRSSATVQKDAKGNAIGSFGVVQDISAGKEFALALHKKVEERTQALERANHSLLQVNEELARSNRHLEEFTRASSHDLKEPIRKVQFFIDRLKGLLSERLTDEEKTLFDRVEVAADRMKLLVDDLLEYSHLDQVPLEKEKINLNQKVNAVLSDLELMIREKAARIDIGPLPTVKGYRRQLQQLFQNLISNAIKYSRPGIVPEIRISARVVLGSDSGYPLPDALMEQSFHLIEVCDNGIGFDPSEAERIFNVFTRLHGHSEYQGTGIGLSIVKKVVENHNGFIYARSEEGKGACFLVLLPVDKES